MRVQSTSGHASVNKRCYEKYQLYKTNEENGRTYLETRTESELPHLKKGLFSWVFIWDFSLAWYKRP